MSIKKHNEKEQRQIEIDQLGEMLWRSTPLGKFLSSRKKKASKFHVQDRQKLKAESEIGAFVYLLLLFLLVLKLEVFKQLLWLRLEIKHGKRQQNARNGKF